MSAQWWVRYPSGDVRGPFTAATIAHTALGVPSTAPIEVSVDRVLWAAAAVHPQFQAELRSQGGGFGASTRASNPGAGLALVGLAVGLVGLMGVIAMFASNRDPVASTPPLTSRPSASPSEPSMRAVPPPAGTTGVAAPPACDPQVAMRATLRGRATGLEYARRTLRLLEAFNTPGAIEALGWAAEPSDQGPPCFATFAYNLNGNRHTVRFKFWPDDPPRLATTGADADSFADAADLTGLNGTWMPTRQQLELATMWRLAGGNVAEDTYLNPNVQGEILTRRRHCVQENVDLTVDSPAARQFVRLFRESRITRFRCVADHPWTLDVPRRGHLQPPYLYPAERTP